MDGNPPRRDASRGETESFDDPRHAATGHKDRAWSAGSCGPETAPRRRGRAPVAVVRTGQSLTHAGDGIARAPDAPPGPRRVLASSVDPLWDSSRATVRSHGPPCNPYLVRRAAESTPGRKCDGVVPSGTVSTGIVRSSMSRTLRARSAVQWLFATMTAALPMMLPRCAA